MANENNNGVFLNPDNGNIIASGQVSASSLAIPSATEVHLSGDVTLQGLLDDKLGTSDGKQVAEALGSLLSSDLDDSLKKRLGIAQGFRYKLVNGVLQHGPIYIEGIQNGECDYVHVEDYCITTITLSTMNNVVIYLPEAVDGRCRDLVLKIKIETETAPEHIAFVSESGEPIVFETDDASWADLEPGINYMLFTETERS